MHLNVSEIFGPTIQGEGRMTGQLASFIRVTGCNLSCDWCDAKYTWDWEQYDHATEVHRMSVDDVITQLEQHPGRIIVTGGEPLLQHHQLAKVIRTMPHRDFDLETNGTRPLGQTRGLWANVSCSPKVGPSAGQTGQGGTGLLHPDILDDPTIDLKFVVRDQTDLDAVDAFITERDINPARVWLMPEGTTGDIITERTPFTANACTARGFNFSSRVHIYAWQDKRGH